MERIKQVYQQLAKYRSPSSCFDSECPEKGGSAIAGVMTPAKVQHMHATSFNDSPSPTTVMTNLNNSGNYMCRSNPSAQSDRNDKIIIYHQNRGLMSGRELHQLSQSQQLQHQQHQLQREQQQQQQHAVGHQPTGNDQYNNLLSSQSSAYVTIKPESPSMAISNNNNDLMNAHFNTLQDQMNHSMIPLGNIGTKLETNSFVYERNQENLYNNQFKVEYSDNYNSGYGMRNANFYGRGHEDELVEQSSVPMKASPESKYQSSPLIQPASLPQVKQLGENQMPLHRLHHGNNHQQRGSLADEHRRQQQQQQLQQQQPMQQSPISGEKLTSGD